MRRRRLTALLLTASLLLPGIVLITELPAAAAAPAYGMVSVQGTSILVDGQAPASKFYGVVDTTALAFAILTYIEGQTQYAGKNSVFNGPDTGRYSAITPNDTADHFFDRYFDLLSYYHCNLVRIGAGDTWASRIQYDAWANHRDAFLSLLRTMEAEAREHSVWVCLVLAGSAEYPTCTFGGSGTVFDRTSSAYANYISYSRGVMAALDGLEGIAWYDVYNEPDHNSCYYSYWSSHGGKTGFNTWATSVATATAGASSHPRTMGVAGLGSMFGWGKTDFDLCTGNVPFEIASRHYYASNTDTYIFSTPEAWARADNKPLYWGELGMNSVYPLVRYTFAEQAIFANGGQAITSMVLTGTAGYPVGTAPVASFTVAPSSGSPATVFTFDASGCSDVQDAASALQVRWDWDGDGTYDTPWTTGKTATHIFAASGTYAVRMQVTNTIGLTDTESAAVTVKAGTPSLAITSPDDGAILGSTTVSLTWGSSYGGSTLTGCTIALDGGTAVSLEPTATSYAFTGLAQGWHTATVSCGYGDGATTSASVSFTVDSIAPVVTITAPAAGSVTGSSVTVTWSGSDGTSGISAYSARMDIGEWVQLSSTVTSYTFGGLSPGAHAAYVRAVDGAGNQKDASVAFTVQGSLPSVTITAPTNGSASASTSMTVRWTASSPGSSIASYQIGLDGGAWTVLASSTTSYTYSGLTQGQHKVTVRAIDQSGGYRDVSVTFVIDTVAPTVTISAPASNAYVSARPTVKWTGSDGSSGMANYLIRADSGTWTTLSPDASSYELNALSSGTHTVTVRATDKAGNYRDASVTFRVDASVPTLSITSPWNGAYAYSTSAPIKWTGSDSGSGLAAYYIKIDSGEWITLSPTTTSYTFTGLSRSTHTVTVRAMDKVGNYRDVSVWFTLR